jgi:hypothetical protein
MRRPAKTLLCLASSFVVAACGGGKSATTAPSAPGTGTSTPAAAPSTSPAPSASAGPSTAAAPVVPSAWSDDLTPEQQSAYMQTKVVPPMSRVFVDHDAKTYADFGCKTCHGPQYLTPTKFLPKLTMKGGKITAFAEKPAIAKWMNDKVVPEMAAAMGQKPYDAATKTGFGCAGCHAVEMK